MTLDEIFDEWREDGNINRTEVGNAALDIVKLHQKYYKYLSREKLLQKKLEAEMKALKLDKYEFYTDGPTQEQIEKGWKLPAKGKILRSDVNMYLDADSDIIQLNLKIAYQNEKIDALESIVKTISNMGFHIKSYIEWEKFRIGA